MYWRVILEVPWFTTTNIKRVGCLLGSYHGELKTVPKPVVYTRVSEFIPWIEETIAEDAALHVTTTNDIKIQWIGQSLTSM